MSTSSDLVCVLIQSRRHAASSAAQRHAAALAREARPHRHLPTGRSGKT